MTVPLTLSSDDTFRSMSSLMQPVINSTMATSATPLSATVLILATPEPTANHP